VQLVRLVSLSVRFHKKEAVSLVPAGVVGIGQAEDVQVIGNRAIGDEHLGAVNDPFIAFSNSGRDGACHVGTCIRFGDGGTDNRISAHQGRQEFFLLLLCAEKLKKLRPEAACDDRIAHTCVDGPEFLGDEAVLQESQPRAAVFLLYKNPNEPEFTGLLPDRRIKGLVPIELLSFFRKEFAEGKFPCRLLDIPLFP
jgi:hypothetical protein